MTGTLVDSSVVIDILSHDTVWYGRSLRAVEAARPRGPVLINQIIYAECVATFLGSPPPLLSDETLLERRDMPWEAALLAEQAHAAYRRRGGAREAILADFLIGAHAAVEGLSLLSRDPRRVRAAFPDLRLITPED